MTDPEHTDPPTEYFARPQGRIAFEVWTPPHAENAPLVLLVPGMGDLRSSYRAVARPLAAAGYRVAVTDLRGHGDSDSTFDDYGDDSTAGDVESLAMHLGGPAVLVGNSMSAGSAVIVAARAPSLVRGLGLLGPFVRDPKTSAITRATMRILMSPLWAARVWTSYLPSLYAGVKPVDFAEHRADIAASMRRPGAARAFALTTRTSHATAEAALPDVTAPALVMMGELDPDFGDPAAEARWIADRLGAAVVMVPDAGHYPHAQRPEIAVPALLSFLAEVAPLASAPPASPSAPPPTPAPTPLATPPATPLATPLAGAGPRA